MQPNEINKRKADMLKSIMRHPKLSKTFSDALSAPIGSTKRDQAKSILSIMKKLGGANTPNYGGMGGPGDSMGFPSSTMPYNMSSVPSNPVGNTQNTGNMVIFPAAPKFKIKPTGGNSNGTRPRNATIRSTGQPDGQGGIGDQTTLNIPSGFGAGSTIPSTPTWASNLSGQSVDSFAIPAPTPSNAINPPNSSQLTVGTDSFNPAPNFTTGGLNGISIPVLPKTWNNLTLPSYTKPSDNSGLSGVPQTNSSTMDWSKFIYPNGVPGPLTSNPVTTTPSVSGESTASNTTGGNTSFGSATTTISKILGVTPTTSLSDIVTQKGLNAVVAAIIKNEGGSPNGVTNNPGNIKFTGASDQINSGVKASDGGTFASYPTLDAGQQAIANMISNPNPSIYGTNPTLQSFIDKYTNTGGSSMVSDTSGTTPKTPVTQGQQWMDDVTSNLPTAVASHVGAMGFATSQLDTNPNSPFAGGLAKSIDDFNDKLKDSLGLPALETQLSDLKNQSGNIVPTLTSYIQGRDKYVGFIDKMIDQTNDQISNGNIGDDVTMNRLNNYLNYLYTLKGRQNARYGQFLNTAVNQYNNDVTNLQNHVDTVTKNYQDKIANQATISQNEYNLQYTALTDAYNQLDQAPLKQANLDMVNSQVIANNAQNVQNAITAANGPAIFKSMAEYEPLVLDSAVDPVTTKTTKILKPSAELDLASMYGKVNQSDLSPAGLTTQVTSGMTSGINDGGLPKVYDYGTMLTTLAQDPTYGPIFAPQIVPAFEKASLDTLKKDIPKDINTYKNALKDLVSSYGGTFGFGKTGSGLTDKTSWLKRYEGTGTGKVDSKILNALFDGVQVFKQQNPGSVFEDPSKITGLSDTDTTNLISEIVSRMWANAILPQTS